MTKRNRYQLPRIHLRDGKWTYFMGYYTWQNMAANGFVWYLNIKEKRT